MKKKNLKSLKLNKKSVSNLTQKNVNGGWTSTILTPAQILVNPSIILDGTKGECDLYSIGHDDGQYCVSQEANWCNGI